MSKQNNSTLAGLAFALAGFAVYSSHDAVVKSLRDYHVFQIVFFAMLFSYVPFSIARIIEAKPQSMSPENPGLLIFRAFLLVGALCSSFYAFSTLPLVEVYVLLFCTPLLISIFAVWFLAEQIAFYRWVAIFAGLVGVMIVLRPSIDTLELGHAAALVASICGAGSAVISRKIGATESMAAMIMFPILAMILVSGSSLYYVYEPMPLEDLAMMFLVGALGLLGQYLVLTGFRKAPAAYVAPMQYSQIVWAILFGYVFFGELIDIWVVIGSIVTIGSGLVIIWRERVASRVQANINTRNGRSVGAPMMRNKEIDEEDWL